ncbi:unnamed protein product [Pedinophyceae sp. YPF-701]|nr:unnamed protein product [Pedinophyceae sp. YPF-701]
MRRPPLSVSVPEGMWDTAPPAPYPQSKFVCTLFHSVAHSDPGGSAFDDSPRSSSFETRRATAPREARGPALPRSAPTAVRGLAAPPEAAVALAGHVDHAVRPLKRSIFEDDDDDEYAADADFRPTAGEGDRTSAAITADFAAPASACYGALSRVTMPEHSAKHFAAGVLPDGNAALVGLPLGQGDNERSERYTGEVPVVRRL